jgi:hypothetical protein
VKIEAADLKRVYTLFVDKDRSTKYILGEQKGEYLYDEKV